MSINWFRSILLILALPACGKSQKAMPLKSSTNMTKVSKSESFDKFSLTDTLAPGELAAEFFQLKERYSARLPNKPVVLYIHGYNGDDKQVSLHGNLIGEIQSRQGTLLTVSGQLNSIGKSFWNAGAACDTDDGNPSHKSMLTDLIEYVKQGYAASELTLIGLSCGASISMELACESILVDNVISLVGTIPKAYSCLRTEPLGTVIVNGTLDKIVNYNGGSIVLDGKKFPEHKSAEETVATFANLNHCKGRSQTPASYQANILNYTGSKYEYDDCLRPTKFLSLEMIHIIPLNAPSFDAEVMSMVGTKQATAIEQVEAEPVKNEAQAETKQEIEQVPIHRSLKSGDYFDHLQGLKEREAEPDYSYEGVSFKVLKTIPENQSNFVYVIRCHNQEGQDHFLITIDATSYKEGQNCGPYQDEGKQGYLYKNLNNNETQAVYNCKIKTEVSSGVPNVNTFATTDLNECKGYQNLGIIGYAP